jgi:hypothetical protein
VVVAIWGASAVVFIWAVLAVIWAAALAHTSGLDREWPLPTWVQDITSADIGVGTAWTMIA